MMMSPNKGETVVHGCHCPCDMIVRMREVLARPWFGVCMALVCTIFTVIFAYAIEFISIYFSRITVIHYISKQIKSARVSVNIFVRWHLAIVITCISKMQLVVCYQCCGLIG